MSDKFNKQVLFDNIAFLVKERGLNGRWCQPRIYLSSKQRRRSYARNRVHCQYSKRTTGKH